MNTAQIKAYAPKARNDFIKAVIERAARFGIHGDNKFDPIEFKGDVAIIGTQVFSKKGGKLREKLVAKVKQQGFEMFIRSHAYTWFNRFVAIRYMEIHDFLNHGFRVLSNTNGSDIPEILEHATEVDLPGLDREKVTELRLAGDKDNELYRMLVIAQCNALHKAMPFLFEAIDNEAELLLPDNLLHTSSPVRKMVSEIDETLWADVEIIGWIYQFYISEKKDEVIGKVVKAEDIPAATQLFTPNWIVKYMVQNTLGRMWMDTYPDSFLKTRMEYYIEPAEQDPEVQEEIDRTTPKELNPEELTFLDPACGSGHILVEAYDILKEIYLERGYRTRDIPRLILKNNLYGLDIDDRAAQLACFAVLMRARNDDRRLFSRDDLKLNIMSIVETKGFDKAKLLDAVSKRDGGKGVWIWINELVELFEDAKTLGSLIRIPTHLLDNLNDIKSIIETDPNVNGDIFNYIAGTELLALKPLLIQTQFLSKGYDCVVTNPPFIGNKYQNSLLKNHLKNHFKNYDKDLFSAFIKQNLNFAKKNGFLAFMSPFVWMFISYYQSLRSEIIDNVTLNSLIQLEYSGFDGATVPVCTFTIINHHFANFTGSYIKLSDFRGAQNQAPKTLEAIKDKKSHWFYTIKPDSFKRIHSYPIAYWISKNTQRIFQDGIPLKDFATPKKGMVTSDNNRFLRRWYEVDIRKIGFGLASREEALNYRKKWIPYNKGGDFRKWFGNNEFIVNWEDDGRELYEYNKELYGSPSRQIQNVKYYFQPSIIWSSVSSSYFGARRSEQGFIFDSGGSSAFPKGQYMNSLTAFLCSSVTFYLLKVMNPTLNFQVGNIAALPIIKDVLDKSNNKLSINVEKLLEIAKSDWNNFEISWEFSFLQILISEIKLTKIEDSYKSYRNHCYENLIEMKSLEEENNSIFINAYGLQNDLCLEIPLSEITLNCNPNYRYSSGKSKDEYKNIQRSDNMKELISYTIGCMMGRYSLDHPCLIYAHSGNIDFDSSKYKTFPADDDGIIPIMDMDWFTDDATKRFVEFIKTAWPQETLDENLKFVADSLNPKANESPEDTIRRYFSTTFFKDHMKTYKKRPIYWLFSSGKQKAFECLVYLHRYNESTLSRMRSSYVTPLQGNISARIEFLDHEKDATTTASTQKKIQKQIDILKKKQVELKTFDDELRHYADMRISLDLDDGVKVNYGKFGNLLAEKKAITGKK